MKKTTTMKKPITSPLDIPLYAPNGEALRDETVPRGEPGTQDNRPMLTLRRVLMTAVSFPGIKDGTPDEKAQRGRLAYRIADPERDAYGLTAEETQVVKRAVAELYAPIIAALVWGYFDRYRVD